MLLVTYRDKHEGYETYVSYLANCVCDVYNMLTLICTISRTRVIWWQHFNRVYRTYGYSFNNYRDRSPN